MGKNRSPWLLQNLGIRKFYRSAKRARRLPPTLVRACAPVAGLTGGLHCDTGFQSEPPRSLRTKVIEPVTAMEFAPIKSMFPPAANVTDPPNVKKVIVSPGPNPL